MRTINPVVELVEISLDRITPALSSPVRSRPQSPPHHGFVQVDYLYLGEESRQ
ncbi:hypothetical protein [Allonocardiopsis opalescens]|uniref:hypothetical protein n=1 Tax=Allonocardiopsis opalescens TaxID=1144618 RepID=UPI001473232D|nr:hypothetical protein [Allonocardiopsis opalescens]